MEGSRPVSTISDLLKLPLNDRREIAFNLLWSLPRHEVIEATKRIASMMQKDILGCLPIELSSLVVSYLDVEDLLSCALVSKDWNRIFDDQGIWASRCISHTPPIRPAKATWDDIKIHSQLMNTPSNPIPEDLNPEFIDDELDDRDMPGHHPQPSLNAVTTLPRGGFAGVRQSVWERTGLGSLPIFTSSPVKLPTPTVIPKEVEPPISSHLPGPSEIPQVNYKHLYLAHRIVSRRIRSNVNDKEARPMIVDAITSIESGGLSGHTEAIYSLSLIRHHLTFNIDQGSKTTYNLLQDGIHSGNTKTQITGRDWLLSGSRDKTLRLWQLDTPKPRVVKVYMGAHEGSVLSTFVVKLKSSESANTERKERIVAISGGSDGKICRWDLEGDGRAEKEVMVHTSSILCVKGNEERTVSCSKDRTIKVLDIHTLEVLITIGDGEPERHRGAINEVGLWKDYILSASGDRSIRLWSIHTGAHLYTLDSAHPRGIASLDFLPKIDDGVVLGTIATGSSDATVRLCQLVSTPSSDDIAADLNALSINEVSEIAPRDATIEEGPVCWTDCVCPPAIRKVNSTHCMRCWNRGHTALVRTLCLNGDYLISGGYDGTVKIWDKSSGKLLNDLIGARTGRVFAVTADSTRVISTGLDCRINIWNFAHSLDTSFIEP